MRPRKIIPWLVVLLAIGTAVYGVRRWQKRSDDEGVKFETSKVDRGPIVAKVTASGTLSALVTVQVGSQVSGRIREILADYNSNVKKGQVIAKLDPMLLSATLEQARANYNAAQGDLLKAKVQAQDAARQLARQRSLAERKLTAQADYDTAEANAGMADASVASAQGRVEQMRAALHQAQVNLDYATIESPIDGVVISRSVDVGQTVAASLQTPTLFVIAEDLRKMQVDTSVAEADVGKLESGMTAAFNVDAYPTDRFEGRVRQIRNAATNVQNVVTYDAVIDVANPDLKLRPGMTANVTFVHANRTNALRVVNAALRFKPAPELLADPADRPKRWQGQSNGAAAQAQAQAQPRAQPRRPKPLTDTAPDRRTLWVLRHKRPVPVQVRVGITDGTHTEILEGVEEGDEIIIDVASTGSGAAPGGQGARGGFRRIL
jgi:HlyD family secretion protein